MAEDVQETAEIKQTWKKIEDVSRKAGLREGISNGRESGFQKYFDIGFREGFKNGYALGKYKGALLAHSRQNSLELVKYPLLEKVRRGGCEVCRNQELENEDVSEIIRRQTEISDKNLSELHSTFSTIFSNIDLPK